MRRYGLWIPLHTEIRSNIKIARLAVALDIEPDLARAKVENLWLSAVEQFPDGALVCNGLPLNAKELAFVCNWKGDPKALQEALLSCKLIEKGPGNAFSIHNWHQFAGTMLEKREKDRERMKSYRSETVREQSAIGLGKSRVEESRVEENIPPQPPQGGGVASEVTEDQGEPPIYTKDPVVFQLLKTAQSITKIPNRRETAIQYLTAAKERFTAEVVEKWLWEPANKGLSVLDMMKSLEASTKPSEQKLIADMMRRMEGNGNVEH